MKKMIIPALYALLVGSNTFCMIVDAEAEAVPEQHPLLNGHPQLSEIVRFRPDDDTYYRVKISSNCRRPHGDATIGARLDRAIHDLDVGGVVSYLNQGANPDGLHAKSFSTPLNFAAALCATGGEAAISHREKVDEPLDRAEVRKRAFLIMGALIQQGADVDLISAMNNSVGVVYTLRYSPLTYAISNLGKSYVTDEEGDATKPDYELVEWLLRHGSSAHKRAHIFVYPPDPDAPVRHSSFVAPRFTPYCCSPMRYAEWTAEQAGDHRLLALLQKYAKNEDDDATIGYDDGATEATD